MKADVMICDPIGEPYVLTAGYGEKAGQPVIQFDPAAQQEAGWLASLLAAIHATPADIVIVGAARSGKSVFSQMLKSCGVKETVTEHRMPAEAPFDKTVELRKS